MIQALSPHQAHDLILRGEVEVIDVRDPSEWTGGHIPTARLVPLEELRANPLAVLGRDGVMFVCAAGVRSQTAARIAASNGLTRIYHLAGGTRGWIRAGLEFADVLDVAV
jgi:rhodanese-related sulfurtransferase